MTAGNIALAMLHAAKLPWPRADFFDDNSISIHTDINNDMQHGPRRHRAHAKDDSNAGHQPLSPKCYAADGARTFIFSCRRASIKADVDIDSQLSQQPGGEDARQSCCCFVD